MGVSDEYRKAQVILLTAKESAGINTRLVKFSIVEFDNPDHAVGSDGTRKETTLTIKPNPEVIMRHREGLTASGNIVVSDVEIHGAFPDALAGEKVTEDFQEPEEISKGYATPEDFIADLRRADSFLINGERFQYSPVPTGGGGSVSIDKFQSKWTLRLVRAEKQ